ncbi:hypothetical protein LWI28_003681 [Acer negundo]|uniref:Uncharacterized protein n=1 Tax=Acer negundo TaxID=4023 RepID=A0AAD5NMQ5_ACENE|nr:hypothetical protein LWI28_003681 [Acer negundo]
MATDRRRDDDDELEIVCEIEEVDEEVKARDPLYVLMCCWLTVVGAGLLKSEEILEGASRLSIEEQKFIALMNEAREVGHSLVYNLFSLYFVQHL